MTAVSTHIFSTMGTVASVRVGPDADVADVIAELKDSFDTIEDTFSLYLDGSELSRMARGEIALWQAGPGYSTRTHRHWTGAPRRTARSHPTGQTG